MNQSETVYKFKINSILDFFFNLFELGIEVIKVISYDLSDNDYLLDGEILELTPKELVRR